MGGKLQAGKHVGISEKVPTAMWCHSGWWFLLQNHVPWLSPSLLCARGILDGAGSTGIQEAQTPARTLLMVSCVASAKSLCPWNS